MRAKATNCRQRAYSLNTFVTSTWNESIHFVQDDSFDQSTGKDGLKGTTLKYFAYCGFRDVHVSG